MGPHAKEVGEGGGVNLVFFMPSLSFTEASVNNITTKEMKVNEFLAALKDRRSKKVKAKASSWESVCSYLELVPVASSLNDETSKLSQLP